jgi:MerR family transcriptional regulator, light-induced transcriptional regulator
LDRGSALGFRIKTVAEMTGVPRNTLLAWERRYGLVSPERQANGYREYSERDVVLLQELKRLVDAGYRVSEAVSLLGERRSETSPLGHTLADEEAIDALFDALTTFDGPAAAQIAGRLRGTPFAAQIQEVYFPLLRRVGDGWAAGQISVVQEHFVSGFCRARLMEMLLQLQLDAAGRGPLAAFACFEDEDHELGLLGVAISFALRGHLVVWLGARCPLADLVGFVVAEQPVTVCVAVQRTPSPEAVVAYARGLREAMPPTGRLLMGGAGIVGLSPPVMAGVWWLTQLNELVELYAVGEG